MWSIAEGSGISYCSCKRIKGNTSVFFNDSVRVASVTPDGVLVSWRFY